MQFATFPETVVSCYPYFSFVQPTYKIGGREHLRMLEQVSYDSMMSLLAPYDSPPATAVASDLDAQVLRLLEAAAGSTGVVTTS